MARFLTAVLAALALASPVAAEPSRHFAPWPALGQPALAGILSGPMTAGGR